MAKPPLALLLFALAACALPAQQPLLVEHGVYGVHLLERTIGTETYDVDDYDTHRKLIVTTTTDDRGTPRTATTTLDYLPNLTPISLEQQIVTPTGTTTSAPIEVHKSNALAFPGFASMPAAMQMMMMRYWLHHHRPPRLPLLRASTSTVLVEIRPVGHDVFTVKGEIVRLTRYTVANLVFGREVLWMNDSERVAAIMTFANGLPREEVLDEYKSAFDPLYQSGVSQELLDLAALTRAVRPLASGTFAIVGARLIDTTGKPPVPDSVVLIHNNRIAAAGPAGTTPIPPGTHIIHAAGDSILPGLWDMHADYSGVEVGPALLASGITTARDCAGEFQFLLAARRAIDQHHQLGPRLLLAGLIDGKSPEAFGLFTAATPGQGAATVDLYADAHFDQISVAAHLQPDVLTAITDEAQKRGLTVTSPAPEGPDNDLISELEHEVQTGMTPLQAIQSATIVPARALHQDADYGTIAPGKRADLVLIQGDPLARITDLRHAVSVITDGRLYSSQSLAHAVGLQR